MQNSTQIAYWPLRFMLGLALFLGFQVVFGQPIDVCEELPTTLECPANEIVECETDITPGVATFTIRDIQQEFFDDDIFVGIMGTGEYSDADTILRLANPLVATGTTITCVELRLFLRVEGVSCESDIDIRVTDPLGNVIEFISPIAGCIGNNGGTPYVFTQTFNPAGLGNGLGEWAIDLKDSNDQNSGALGGAIPDGTEFSLRFGDIRYFTERVEEVNFIAGPIVDGTPDCDNTTYSYTYLATHPTTGEVFTCDQVFTIDNAEPTIACPAGGIVECASDIVVGTPTFSVSCGLTGNLDVSNPIISGDENCPGTTYTYIHQVTDDCDRISLCEQVFTIDNAAPTIAAPADATVECAADISINATNANVTSSCGINTDVEITGPAVLGLEDCDGTTYTYTYTVEDDCGRMASDTQVFTLSNAAPTIDCPAGGTIECASDIVVGTPTFSVSCGTGSPSVSNPIIIGDENCPGTTYTYIHQVSDECGRTALCEQVFTIDNPAPTIAAPADATVECAADISINATNANVTSSCGINTDVEITGPAVLGLEDCDGTTYTYTYTVEDDCGRMASDIQVFTLSNAAPTIAAPADATVECASDISTNATNANATTSCGLTSNVIITGPAIAGDENCDGTTYTYTYTVTDACGRTASDTQVFTLSNAAPTIAAPADATVECASDISTNATNANATTSCGLTSNVIITGPAIAGDENCDGTTYTYTYTVTDACGRTASDTQVFTLSNAAPTIAAPADATVECASDISTNATNANVTTSCGLTSNVIITGPAISGDENCDGTTYTYTYTVTDACGRTASDTQVFTLSNAAPTIAAPADATVECASDISTNATNANVTTSCGLTSNVIITGPAIAGDENCDGTTYTYTYTVTDECGRTASDTQVFTLSNTAPTIAAPADATVECASDISTNATNANVTTSCGLTSNVIITGPAISGDENCDGTTYTYTYTVTDACGRTASDTQIFTLSNAAPTIAAPADATVECASDISVSEANAITTTSCGLNSTVTVSSPDIAGDEDCAGTTYTYTYKIADECGRTTTDNQVFTIQNDGPTITQCPADAVVSCATDAIVGVPLYTTSCGLGADASAVGPAVNGNPNCPGTTHIYTYTVTDDCGRTTTCQQTYTIDNAAPIITCPPNCPVVCEADILPGTPEYTTSCGVTATLSMTGPIIVGDPGCDGTTYTYTHTITDECGRTASCEQVFTITNDCQFIDFDFDDNGNPLPPGTIISDQYDDFTVSTEYSYHYAMLFDTDNPTSGDFDLGTPNEAYGGPGVGAGGVNNTIFQGNALVVSKDDEIPDETEGQLIFEFNCSVTIKTVDLLDMKCGDSEVELYDEHGNLIEYLDIPAYGVNSFNTFDVYTSGVYTMIIDLDCGGGVTGFKYCKDDTPGASCNDGLACADYNLDFSENGNDWAANDESGSFDVDGQLYSISIADPDNILIDTQEDGTGLEVGIDPEDVLDEVVITYTLSQVSSHVVFDITDLDYKDGGSKQQEAVCVYGLLGADATQIMPLITSLDGSVSINGNCAEATTNSAYGDDESVLVEFTQCIDQIVIVYGTGTNSPTAYPSYSSITIGASVGFGSEVCPGSCLPDCGSGGDSDGDGVCNAEDVCPGGDDNIDTDGDGIPNACDDMCYDYAVDHGGCGAGWEDNDTSGSTEFGNNETVDINIADADDILVDSGADDPGLAVGIDPDNVDDELIVTYTLSQSSSHVVFDITDLDYKDGASKQQEAVCVYGLLGNNPAQVLPVITSLDGSVAINGNCAEATTNSAYGNDESVLVEFTQCIDQIVIVYGTGSDSPTSDPTYSTITIGASQFDVEQCKEGCNCPADGSNGGGDDDNDGVCNSEDVCPGGDDFADADGDGVPNFCDDDCTGSGGAGDSDGDGICDDVDACPGFDDSVDNNNNGIPDGCDINCETSTLNFTESGYHWNSHATSGSYTSAGQTYDINITDADNILEYTGEDDLGIKIAIDPDNTSDELVMTYQLSAASDNVVFDIVDLDRKTGGSKQQEAVCVYGLLGNDLTEIMPVISQLDGSVAINGNCAEATANSSYSGDDESVLVTFTDCIDQVVIVYGTGSNSPTNDPSYSSITIGEYLGFSSLVCDTPCDGSQREDESEATINIYPNPTSSGSTISITVDNVYEDVDLLIYDELGRLIVQDNLSLTGGTTTYDLSAKAFAGGVYFVKIRTAAWTTNTYKLVVID